MMRRLLPIPNWMPSYKREYLSGDLMAGITVGIMLIPQGMAYAMIAGLPPVFGLYAALIPQVIYAFTGTSRQLAVGPVAMDSLLVASGLGALSLSGLTEYIQMAVFLSLIMGGFQFLLGVLRMGFLVNFLSRPVISGFTSAAAVIIGLSQLKHLLGTEIARSNKVHVLLFNALDTLGSTHLLTLGIGIGAIALIKALRSWNRSIPGSLIAVVLGTVLVYSMDGSDLGVAIVGEVPDGLPSFSPIVEGWERFSELVPIAITLALVAFMEAISVAKAMEEKYGTNHVRPNQELVALGISNMLGSLFQSYPTTGGFSRTAVNDQAGARTPLALLVSAGVVAATLLFLTPLFHYLPNAVLAAIIMVAVSGLIDLSYPRQLYQNRKDEFLLLLFTFAITLFVGITEGILLGILVSLLLLVYRTSQPHIAVLGKIRGTEYFRNVDRFAEDVETHDGILAFRFDAQIYFGNKDYFKKEILALVDNYPTTLKTIILNAEAINYLDSSGVFMLRQLIRELKEKGILFLLANPIGPVRDILHSSGLIEDIGRKHVYPNIREAYSHAVLQTERTDIQEKVSLQTKSK